MQPVPTPELELVSGGHHCHHHHHRHHGHSPIVFEINIIDSNIAIVSNQSANLSIGSSGGAQFSGVAIYQSIGG